MARALPSEPRELLKLRRNYVSTVIYTLCGQPFIDWVNTKIKERNEHIEESRDLNVMMDAEIAQILQNSHSISVNKGISNNLLKVSTPLEAIGV